MIICVAPASGVEMGAGGGGGGGGGAGQLPPGADLGGGGGGGGTKMPRCWVYIARMFIDYRISYCCTKRMPEPSSEEYRTEFCN